jgi:uncharacterized protein (DUF2252 family)
VAWDLSNTPASGLPVIICGDCHVNNFGLYGTPQGDVVFDINDLDEAAIGPWEWDLKRLTASVNVLGRENELNAKERRLAVMMCATGYRVNLQRLHSLGILDLWFLHTVADRLALRWSSEGIRGSPRCGRRRNRSWPRPWPRHARRSSVAVL